jgi:hypothetical protein
LLHDIHYFATSVVSFPGYPSAYLLVKTEPAASITHHLQSSLKQLILIRVFVFLVLLE